MRCGVVLLLAAAAMADPGQERFDATVAPVLRKKCISCHAAQVRSGGLSLETREDIVRGGKSGPAMVAGRPVDSLVLALAANGKMPMGGPKLLDAELAAIRAWIEVEDKRPEVLERDVQAIFSAKCWVCHGRRDKRADLDLRTHASMRKGGKSGPAIAPGDPDASLVVKRIAANEMPPPKLQEQYSVRGLTDEELAKVKQWITAGARPDSEQPVTVTGADPAIKSKDREFWSFRPPVRPPVPRVKASARVRNPIDAFLLAKLESKGMTYSPEASAGVLARRAWFALAGLPPSPDDPPASSYEALVKQLLDSPRYGERWGRHWLDAVGYTDSDGGNNLDAMRPHAYRYRDYVIRALNENKPYDRFLVEQLAGDELFDYRSAKEYTPAQVDLLAATGFWRMAPDSTYSTEQNFIPERMDVIANQLDVLGTAVMGLTIGCARCHDHKYDPLPTRDYYRLAAVITPAYDPFHWLPPNLNCGGVGAKCDESNTRFLPNKSPDEALDLKAVNAPVEERIADLRAQLKTATAEQKTGINAKIRDERAKLKQAPLIRALFDLGPEAPPTRVLMRGDPAAPATLVAPGPPSILSAGIGEYRLEPVAHSSGRRLALARWITQPGHALTARVLVNRIWQQHFGVGLVATSGNFGRMGTAPSHPELLDWLAVEFVESGWDMKALHRLIMTSSAYRQASRFDERAHASDPDNLLLARFPYRRVEAEVVRDAILRVSGRLDLKPFGPADAIKEMPDGEVITESRRRTVFVAHRRTRPVSLLETFDQPFFSPNCVRRGESVVSSQALHLMNSDLVRESARHMAGRLMDAAGPDRRGQVERAYRLAYARPPSAEESAAAVRAIESMTRDWETEIRKDPPAEPVKPRAEWLALASFCHTLMNSAEFLYID